MSLAAVNTATQVSPNHSQVNQPPKPVRNQTQQPSVQNANGPQTPTEAAESVQNTGNHTQVQQEQSQNSQANPLTSSQQSIHNQRILTGGA